MQNRKENMHILFIFYLGYNINKSFRKWAIISMEHTYILK